MTQFRIDPEGLRGFADILEYPRPGYAEMVREIARRPSMGGSIGGSAGDAGLSRFADWASSVTLAETEEIYTATFDLEPLCSPHAGAHLFPDPAARSLFLAELASLYKRRGFIRGSELPDHLPVILRFLAADAGSEEGREIISDAVIPAVSRMSVLLAEASSPYRLVFDALGRFLGRAVRLRDALRQPVSSIGPRADPVVSSEVDQTSGLRPGPREEWWISRR